MGGDGSGIIKLFSSNKERKHLNLAELPTFEVPSLVLKHIVCGKTGSILVETAEKNMNTKRITKEGEIEDRMALEKINQGPAKNPSTQSK